MLQYGRFSSHLWKVVDVLDKQEDDNFSLCIGQCKLLDGIGYAALKLDIGSLTCEGGKNFCIAHNLQQLSLGLAFLHISAEDRVYAVYSRVPMLSSMHHSAI